MKAHIKTYPVKSPIAHRPSPTCALRADLRPDPHQPRTEFPPDPEFDESTRVNGILEPLVVRPDPEGKTKWMIVEGERRWRRAGALKLERLPITVREFADERALRNYQRIVGTQRLNLSALEEAAALDRELKARQAANPKFSVSDLAAAIGKGRATTYEALSLLKLEPAVSGALKNGVINPSQAVRVAVVPLPADQKQLLKWLQEQQEYTGTVSVRDLEEEIAREYCKHLKGAPFKTDKMYETQGTETSPHEKNKPGMLQPCESCPLRSGNLPNWPDQKKKDFCLQPACYRAKALAAATRRGEKTLTAEQFEQQQDKFLRGAEHRNWGHGDYHYQSATQAMGKHAPPPVTVVTKSGEIEQVFPKAEAKAAMAKNGLKMEKPRGKSGGNSEGKQYAAANVLRVKTMKATLPLLLQRVGEICVKPAAQSGLLGWLIARAEDGLYLDDGTAKRIAKLPIGQALAAVIEAFFKQNDQVVNDAYGEYPDEFESLCKLADIDLKAEEKKVAAELTKAKPALPPKNAKGAKKSK